MWTDEAVATIAALPRGLPPVITVANRSYGRVLDNWAWFIKQAGITNAVVLSLDAPTADRVRALGLTAVRAESSDDMVEILYVRTQLLAALLHAGVGFVHSDLDALWLADARPVLLAEPDDMVFSPGTMWPKEIGAKWGLVACCGLFLARARPVTARFLDTVLPRILSQNVDDQVVSNFVMDEWGMSWDEVPFDWVTTRAGLVFKSLHRPMHGRAGDLSVALMPEVQFTRQQLYPPTALVVHPPSPPSEDGKRRIMQQIGLWAVD